MLISNLFRGSYPAKCYYCNDSGHEYVFKIKSVILDNDPEIEICEKCLMEKITGEKQTYNQERWTKYKTGKKQAWWHLWR